MEEQIDKKVWTEKPFKIENTHLREQGIVDSKFRLIGINGKKLRIKRNNQTGKIKMVRKKIGSKNIRIFFIIYMIHGLNYIHLKNLRQLIYVMKKE